MWRPAARVHRWVREWSPALLLGLLTIGAYGVVQYAIGVLVPAIKADEGWGAATLSGAFALGVLLSGPIAVASGYALDRAGSRVVLLLTWSTGTALLWVSSYAGGARAFAGLWAAGAGLVGGGLYYPITMATLARRYPEQRRASAFSILTLLGALASPVFYPLAGWLVSTLGWREAIRALVLCMGLLVLPAALTVDVRSRRPTPRSARQARWLAATLQTVRQPDVRLLLLTLALVSGAVNALHLHQVGAMQAAGLSLAAASGFAGARGFLQIPGRVVLGPLVSRLGLRGTAACAYGAGAIGTTALWVALAGGASSLPLAALFTAATGLSIGLLSPVHGLLAVDVYGEERLGTLSGVQQLVVSLAGAAGSWAAGLLTTRASGGYEASLALVVGALLAAIATLSVQARRSRGTTRADLGYDVNP